VLQRRYLLGSRFFARSKCLVSDVAGGAGIGTGRLARTLRARYRLQAASERLSEEAAVASNAMLAELLGSTISCIISRSP
jgi:hypothetical protein